MLTLLKWCYFKATMSLLTKCYCFFFPAAREQICGKQWQMRSHRREQMESRTNLYRWDGEGIYFTEREREGERGRDGAKCSLRAQMKMRNKGKSDSYDLAQRQPHRETVFIMESVKWLCRRLEEWKRNEGTDWGFYLLRLFCHLNTTFVLSQKQRLSIGRVDVDI